MHLCLYVVKIYMTRLVFVLLVTDFDCRRVGAQLRGPPTNQTVRTIYILDLYSCTGTKWVKVARKPMQEAHWGSAHSHLVIRTTRVYLVCLEQTLPAHIESFIY